MAEQHLAAPTTQGPAGRAGQGSVPSSGPRFADDTNASGTGEVQWNVQVQAIKPQLSRSENVHLASNNQGAGQLRGCETLARHCS